MGKSKIIRIADHEMDVGKGGYLLYQGRKIIDIAELPDGSSEMRYCDDAENPLPDSPRIICGPPPLLE